MKSLAMELGMRVESAAAGSPARKSEGKGVAFAEVMGAASGQDDSALRPGLPVRPIQPVDPGNDPVEVRPVAVAPIEIGSVEGDATVLAQPVNPARNPIAPLPGKPNSPDPQGNDPVEVRPVAVAPIEIGSVEGDATVLAQPVAPVVGSPVNPDLKVGKPAHGTVAGDLGHGRLTPKKELAPAEAETPAAAAPVAENAAGVVVVPVVPIAAQAVVVDKAAEQTVAVPSVKPARKGVAEAGRAPEASAVTAATGTPVAPAPVGVAPLKAPESVPVVAGHPVVVAHDQAMGSGVVTVAPVVAAHAPVTGPGVVASHAAPAAAGAAAPEGAELETRTFVSTPKVLEIGVPDGTHGWLRVRAEMGRDGEVQASFTAANDGAAAQLHKELPGMQAYLASEQVGVGSLVVNAMDRGAATYGAGGESAQRDSSGGRQPGGADLPVREFGSEAGERELPAALFVGSARSGGWLSVRV